MKKKTKVLIVFAIILCIGNIARNIIETGAIIVYMLNKSGQEAIMEERELTGLDFSEAEMIENVNNTGFFGDGVKFEVWKFDKKYIASLPKGFFKEPVWKSYPLSEEMHKLLYGFEENNWLYTSEFVYPYDEEKLFFPEVEKGYYFFLNKGENVKNPMDESERGNDYIVAVFDVEKNILYYAISSR